jgi:hypothetical protein
MIRKAAIGLVVLAASFVVVGLLLPRTWHVERSVVIAAPPERIHPFVSTLKRWQEWSVWTKEMDPQVRHGYSGPEEGAGAEWSWLGPKMGRGHLKIADSSPAIGVLIDEAIESDEINAHARFVYAPDGGGTKVTWTDEGRLPPVLGGYFRGSIETMLGGHFETGLQKLKRLVEALPPPPPPKTVEPTLEAAPDGGAVDGGRAQEPAGARP